ncbi:hypothetical protein HI914_06683 [Erysiphe necator]|nr:hypothetical protein HI914_06683 [Erysiphe necator]
MTTNTSPANPYCRRFAPQRVRLDLNKVEKMIVSIFLGLQHYGITQQWVAKDMNDPRVNTQRTEDPPLFVLIVAKIDDIQNLFVTAFKEPKNVP